MSNTSKLLVVIPMIFSLMFVSADTMLGLDVQEYHINIIEMILGGTMIGGTANAGFKRYLKMKPEVEKLKVKVEKLRSS